MAHIQVEASVRTHRKFLKAGPAASWLWLCSVGYCQDGLTDGFIPFEALDYLGVKAPQKLKTQLVTVGLWDEVPGGWKVHDYDKSNKLRSEILRVKAERKAGGSKGGRPEKEPSTETLKVSDRVNHTENPYPDTDTDTTTETPTVRPPRASPLIARRRLDAAFEGPRVWVPQRLHNDFLSLRNGNEPELFAFYQAVSDEWSDGRWKDAEPGPDMFRFWKARYDERWPSTTTVQPQQTRRPAWAQKAARP